VRDELRRLADSIVVRAQRPGTLYWLAVALGRIQHRETAIRLLRDAQSANPGDFWLNFELGSALSYQEDYEGAIRFFTAAVALRPKVTIALYNLGVNLGRKGRPDEAIVAYRESIRVEPTWAAYLNFGNALSAKGLLDDAIAATREAIRLQPGNFKPHVNLGVQLSSKGKHDEAIASFREAIRLKSDDHVAYNGLGNALLTPAAHRHPISTTTASQTASCATSAPGQIGPGSISAVRSASNWVTAPGDLAPRRRFGGGIWRLQQ
jgi:tetratricopeptide (TPR) repeat protein